MGLILCGLFYRVFGMGIFKGVILIVGGGFYGKFILLNVIQVGVYNYIFGDGCEFVCIDFIVFII